VIKRHNKPWQLTPAPALSWRDGVPYSDTFDDYYFSSVDGMAEGRYVFLDGIQLSQRLRSMASGDTLTIAELGFGTGLNFLLTLHDWLLYRQPGTALTYIGIEGYPLRRSVLEQVLDHFPELRDLASMLLSDWPSPTYGCHRIRWPHWGITLDLWWETASEALTDLASRRRTLVDCWYLDGFAPARSDGMWTEPVYSAIGQLSREHSSFATFTAASDVRRALEGVGFSVVKRSGFGPKRECLIGTLLAKHTGAQNKQTPWDLNPVPQHPGNVVVLGAGLAGSFIARSLAERGIEVRVIDSAAIATGGSSNLQGLTYTRLSHQFAPLGDFSIAAYDYSTRLYAQLLRARKLIPEEDGALCGYLQASSDTAIEQLRTDWGDDSDLVQFLTAEAASQQLGLTVEHPAIYFPDALWLHPPAVCRERLNHPLIQVTENCGMIDYHRQGNRWQLLSASGWSTDASTLILATAEHIRQSPLTHWLPLQSIRGQVTHIAADDYSNQIRCAFCHEGYFPPARLGIHCIGATYGPNDSALDERLEDHEQNIKTLSKWLPGMKWQSMKAAQAGHVALRCTTTDYLPIAGPIPDRIAFNHRYAHLSKRKSTVIDEPCPVVPGLWAMGGLGSRGLTAAPLAAETIVAELLGEAPPLPRYLQQAIAPARFLHRGLVKGAPL